MCLRLTQFCNKLGKTSSVKKKTKQKKGHSSYGLPKVRYTPEWEILGKVEQTKITKMTPQDVFLHATKHCEAQEFMKCYVGFQYFQDKYPSIVEGFTNAAVALERLNEVERAKAMYKVAIEKFPESEKPLNSYINLLQMEAVHHFSVKAYKEAYQRYKEIVKLAPGIYDAWINLGNIEESKSKTSKHMYI